MPISYVGGATGTTSCTLPTHQVGDLILIFSFRDGSTTAPSLPAGYTNVTSSGANTCSIRVGYRVATTTSETSGTWTNATSVVAHVYRGVDGTTPIGGGAVGGGASTTVSYTGFTLTVTNGTSWVVGFSGHRSTNTTLETAPTGMSNRTTVADATDEAAGHDTGSAVSSWSTQNVSVGGTSSGWRSYALELLAGDRSLTGERGNFTLSGQAAELTASSDATGGDPAPLPFVGLLLQSDSLSQAGNFFATGQDAVLGIAQVADVTTFNESGQGASFGLTMPATHGTYALTGIPAELTESTTGGVEAPAPLPFLSSLLGETDNTTLTGETGTFSASGSAVLAVGLLGGEGSFTETGQDATFKVVLSGAAGSFILTGLSTGGSEVLAGDAGSFSLSGSAALSITMPGAVGSYVFTGQDAALTEDPPEGVFNPAPLPFLSSIMATGTTLPTGDYEVAGIDAPLTVGLAAESQSFAVTGQDATLREGVTSALEVGTFTVTGFPTDPENTILRISMRAGEGVFAVAGQNADFSVTGGTSITGETGTFTVTGRDATLAVTMPAAGDAYVWTGQTATFRAAFQTDHTLVQVSGQAASLDIDMPSEYRDIAYTGQSAGLPITLAAEVGLFSVSVGSATLVADQATLTVSGQDVGLHLSMPGEVGAYLVVGANIPFTASFELPTTVVGAAGPPNHRRRRRVILPDDRMVYVTDVELRQLLKEFVVKTPVRELKKPRKERKTVRLVETDFKKIPLPDFETEEEFKLELPGLYAWKPDPETYERVLARVNDDKQRRRRQKVAMLLMMT